MTIKSTQQTPGAGYHATGLLRECSVADMARLRAVARERRLEPSQILFDQGDVAVAGYLVTDGTADVLVAGRQAFEVAAGALIGDVDVLARRPYRNTVVAGTPMTVWKISASDFDRLLVEAPTFARAVTLDLSHRLRTVELASR